jgi:uncharacterized RDD family membrane protein YckC
VRKLRVLTPELAPLEYRLAGLPERGLAWLVDASLVLAATSVVYVLAAAFGAATAGFGKSPAMGVAMVAALVIEVGYRWWAEMRWRGRTVGKRALRLRAVQDNGAELLGWQSFVRNVARPLDALPLFNLVGATSIVLDPLSRRLGDRLAGTVVVREVAYDPPRVVRLPSDAENSLAQDAAAASRIRARLTQRDGAVLAEFVAAAPRIDTVRRLALAARLARHFRDRLGLAAHAGLPDEILLRGIVGVLARDRFGATRAGRRS